MQVWLGYGEVLVMGFGEPPLPPPVAPRRYSHLPHQLLTNFADWWIERDGRMVGGGDDERDLATRAAEQAVGKRVLDWETSDTLTCLSLRFDDGWALRIAAWDEPEDRASDAWSIRGPDGVYMHITCGGLAYLQHGDEHGPFLPYREGSAGK